MMFCAKTLEMKTHSQKLMDVSDVQVSDEDGYLSPQHDDQSEQQDCERANFDDDSQFANKIVKEFGRSIHRLASKIEFQPLEPGH